MSDETERQLRAKLEDGTITNEDADEVRRFADFLADAVPHPNRPGTSSVPRLAALIKEYFPQEGQTLSTDLVQLPKYDDAGEETGETYEVRLLAAEAKVVVGAQTYVDPLAEPEVVATATWQLLKNLRDQAALATAATGRLATRGAVRWVIRYAYASAVEEQFARRQRGEDVNLYDLIAEALEERFTLTEKGTDS